MKNIYLKVRGVAFVFKNGSLRPCSRYSKVQFVLQFINAYYGKAGIAPNWCSSGAMPACI
ncbi:hypothetical protein [Niabella hirudinis]|uniref:hypothetical protein n=1 Tax=Niabella hirudinis TaxID=1285929 RepID=UPI003EBEB74D